MKKSVLFLFFLICYFVSFSQTNAKVNTTTDAYSILNKILTITGKENFDGSMVMGRLGGESFFKFNQFKINSSLGIIYFPSSAPFTSYGERYKLSNFHFENNGIYRTKILTANWGGSYGRFILWMNTATIISKGSDESQTPKITKKNSIFMRLYSTENINLWRYTAEFDFRKTQFLEIYNLLTYTNKSIDYIIMEDSIAAKRKFIQDSIDSKNKLKQDSITSKKKFIQDSINLIKYRKIIGSPIRIKNLLVAQFNFPKGTTLKQTRKVFELLGDNWRLLSINEIKIL